MQFTYVASVILELTLLQSFTSLNISFSAITEFMKDVFGQTTEEVHEAGLVDATSPEMFDQKLEELHVVWDKREKLVSPHHQPCFFEWFSREKASEYAFTIARIGWAWKSSFPILH